MWTRGRLRGAGDHRGPGARFDGVEEAGERAQPPGRHPRQLVGVGGLVQQQERQRRYDVRHRDPGYDQQGDLPGDAAWPQARAEPPRGS